MMRRFVASVLRLIADVGHLVSAHIGLAAESLDPTPTVDPDRRIHGGLRLVPDDGPDHAA